jgi:eukaryotic-like serine/threonine-protein kinase
MRYPLGGTLSEVGPNAAELLVGSTLEGGWQVTERLPRRLGATGGNFSVGYRVEHPDGRRGFCKALDYAQALRQPDTPEALRRATEEYIFERDLHRKCEEYRMTRILAALDDGQTVVPDCPIGRVDYIIFELAECDVRRELDIEADLEATLRLRFLHNVAVALRQLHQHNIAHQDIKPSNVLVLRSRDGQRSSKLGDLGRATDASRPAMHDVYDIAGDRNYAPPEQLYGAIPIEFGPRRLACDVYQLGSLATFMFVGATMNSLLSAELYPGHSWRAWAGTYEEVLPYVQDAFGKVIEKVRITITPVVADDLTALIRCLCEPDPSRRGHPGNGITSPYALQRVVTRLDLLTRRAAKSVSGK